MRCRSLVTLLACLAVAVPAVSQVREIPLHWLNVELLVGDWVYETFAVSLGGRLYRGFGYPVGGARFGVGGFDRFRAAAGVKDGSRASCEMTVESDGRVAWRERVRPGEPARELDVVITGHRTLTLRTGSADAVFAEPRLVHGLPAPSEPAPSTTGAPATNSAAAAASNALRAHAPVRPEVGPLAGRTAYGNSFALLVGVHEYAQLPPDQWPRQAAADTQSIRDSLVQSYGFPPENVQVLTGAQATLQSVKGALASLSAADRVTPDSRVA